MQQFKPLSLRRNFSWTFIGNAVYAACQWGMLVVLAKLGSPEMVGQFTLGLAITAPIIMFTNLQLRTVQATDAKEEYSFADYLGLRLIATAIALITIAIITLSSGYRWESALVILLIAVAKSFEAISDVFQGLLQQHERMDSIAISLMLKGTLSLLLLGLGVFWSGQIIWGVVGLAIAWAAILFGYDWRCGDRILNFNFQKSKQTSKPILLRIKPRWHLNTIIRIVWLTLPLGLVMMLISLNTNIPRYFIERQMGERELGIFAAIAYLITVGNMIIGALGDSATPRLAKYYAANNLKAFRGLLLKLVGIATLVGTIAISISVVAGREILTLLYRSEYGRHQNLLVLLMIAGAFSYISSFLGYGMTAARCFRIQIPLFVSVATVLSLACFRLIPKFGLQGVAIALLISSLVQVLSSSGVILYALRKNQKTQ